MPRPKLNSPSFYHRSPASFPARRTRLRERASIINSAGYRVTPAILSPVIRPYFYGRAEHVNTDDVRRARCARTIWFDDARQPLLVSAHRRSLSLALLLFPSLFPPRASKDRTLYESPALREAPANISSAGSGPRAFRFFLSATKRASEFLARMRCRLCEVFSHPRLF